MSAAGREYLDDWMRQIAMDPAYAEWADDMDVGDMEAMEAEDRQDYQLTQHIKTSENTK